MIARRPLLLAGVLLLVAACSNAGTDDPLQSTLEATPGAATSEPDVQESGPPPAPPSAEPPATDEPAVTQTDTDWGRIWDTLPAGFPVYPDAVETEEAGAGEPVSASFSSPAAADEIATWLQSRLELATFSTVAFSGPFEDGSLVLDSVGDGDCRIETAVAPAGSLTIITIRYGADCPFE